LTCAHQKKKDCYYYYSYISILITSIKVQATKNDTIIKMSAFIRKKNVCENHLNVFLALNSTTTTTMSCRSGGEQHRNRGGKLMKNK
jgi:hypothetical protein